jgi:hypothetical protein
VSRDRPFQDHGFFIFNATETSHINVIAVPAGKDLVLTYMTAFSEPVTGGADVPLAVNVQDGSGTGGAAIYLPLRQAGTAWTGSEPTQVLFASNAVVSSYRLSSAGTARVSWEVSGYLIDE